MRILVLENEPSSALGGQELSLYDVCRGLAARGHQIELLYTHDGNLLDGYKRFARRVDRVSGYSIDRSRTNRAVFRLLADAWQPGREAPDLIYANQYQDSLYARMLAMRFRRPFVCHLRLPAPDRFCGQYRWGMRGAVRLIAISEATRREYVRSGFREDRIDVVHNGLDLEQWRASVSRMDARKLLGIREDAIVVGYAGRLNHRKGIDVLIDAVSLLPARWTVAIAGQNTADGSGRDMERELRARAEERSVASRCLFLGHLTSVATMYRAADLTALPSTSSEAFGRVIIESMACGTPVVASLIGGIPEILTGEFGRGLCPPNDAPALAERLTDVYSWRQSDPDASRKCRDHVVSHFSLSKTIALVETILGNVVDEWRRGDAVPRAAARLTSGAGV
jgi:glycosyltransferase involved in cell wall biosynthesis